MKSPNKTYQGSRVKTTSLKRNTRKELFEEIDVLKADGYKLLSQYLDYRGKLFIATMQKITT